RIHLLATVLVLISAWVLDVSRQDWLWLILAIALVWISEAVNTAIEYLCDVVSPEISENVKRTKDIAAGVVLIAAFAAVIIGISVFGTYICALF
ncbi:MAG: diacylglycerol kinase family protein, partial [Amylibacter sp.]